MKGYERCKVMQTEERLGTPKQKNSELERTKKEMNNSLHKRSFKLDKNPITNSLQVKRCHGYWEEVGEREKEQFWDLSYEAFDGLFESANETGIVSK